MSALSKRLAGKARSVLAKQGTALTLTRSVPGEYDPELSRPGPGTSTTYAVRGLIGPESASGDRRDAEFGPGTLVHVFRRKVEIHSIPGIIPEPGDTIGPISGRHLTITGVTTQELDGEPITHTLKTER